MNVSSFVGIITEIFSKIGVEAIFHGNVDAKDAEKAKKEILAQLERKEGAGLARKKYPPQPVLRLPPKSHTVKCLAKDATDPNSAVEIYFQVGKDKTEDRVMVDLLMEMMYEPLYDQIRTKDQFGYQVSCDARWTDGVIGMQFQVVTSSKSAQEAQDRMERFIGDFRQTIVDMTLEDLMNHVIGLAKTKLEMFNSLREETNHYWGEIRDGRYLWESHREEVLCLKTLDKPKILKAYDQWLSPSSKSRRMVAIQVIASEGKASDGKPEYDPQAQQGVDDFNDECVHLFRTQHCKHQTFGRIY